MCVCVYVFRLISGFLGNGPQTEFKHSHRKDSTCIHTQYKPAFCISDSSSVPPTCHPLPSSLWSMRRALIRVPSLCSSAILTLYQMAPSFPFQTDQRTYEKERAVDNNRDPRIAYPRIPDFWFGCNVVVPFSFDWIHSNHHCIFRSSFHFICHTLV